MKYLVYILLFCFSTLKAQNLITNPSFEEIDSCYGQPAEIGFDVFKWSGCKGWSNPIKSSSDLWCQNPVVGSQIPPNVISYQLPKNGENMAGILIFDPLVISYREYLQNKLLNKLTHDTNYKLSFYYSVAYGKESGLCPANQFGVYGSEFEVHDSMLLNLGNLSLLGVSDTLKFIDDSSSWSKCEIFFKAKGNEEFLIFGNFQDSTNTTYNKPCDTSFWNGFILAGDYYFIDDFSLEELPFSFSIPNVFSPNGDGINDLFLPTISNLNKWELVVFNRWGNEICKLNQNDFSWGGENYTDGIYFYQFKSDLYNINEHGYFQLIR